MPKLSYHFIINPTSGNKQDLHALIAAITSVFSEKNFEIEQTKFAGHASKLAVAAAAQKIDVVVAVGGDGTLNEVASGLVHSQTALGIIPRGSGNGFARSLGVPLKHTDALKLLLKPNIISIDAARINNGYFFGLAGVGLDAQISKAFQEFGQRGPLPYFWVGLKEFFKYPYLEIEIQSEEKTLFVNPLTITIANTAQYGNGAIIAPMADFQDGALDVCIVQRIPIYKMLTSMSALFNGKITQNPYYSSFKSKKIKIINHKANGLYHVDGEPKTDGGELNIEVLPKAVKVITNYKL